MSKKNGLSAKVFTLMAAKSIIMVTFQLTYIIIYTRSLTKNIVNKKKI